MLAFHYADIRQLHRLRDSSGSLFTFRGLLHIAGVAIANHRAMRIASWLIDIVLLVARSCGDRASTRSCTRG
jgi:hypothetical protein